MAVARNEIREALQELADRHNVERELQHEIERRTEP
jgi:hypothetical protein